MPSVCWLLFFLGINHLRNIFASYSSTVLLLVGLQKLVSYLNFLLGVRIFQYVVSQMQ